MKRHSYRKFGMAMAIGFGAACGLLMLDQHTRHRVTKRVRRTAKAIQRQKSEWIDTARSLLGSGEKKIGYVLHKGRRVYHSLAS